MQYVRSLSGSVSKTWNSINPATLSGAIDVVVVEQEDGSLACSPFHVRFGKFSLLRPFEKKVEFKVNDIKQDYSMKLGEGGEAFFVFETSDDIPESLQTSPLVSPAASPNSLSVRNAISGPGLQEPEFLDLSDTPKKPATQYLQSNGINVLRPGQKAQSDLGTLSPPSTSPLQQNERPKSGDWSLPLTKVPSRLDRASSEGLIPDSARLRITPFEPAESKPAVNRTLTSLPSEGRSSPPQLSTDEAISRAIALSKKLHGSNIPTHVTDTGDLMLDMNGYKSSEEDALRAELVARKILSEELEGNSDIGALIGADERGNLWIYSSEEAKEAAARKIDSTRLSPSTLISDASSDPGYHSDDDRSLLEADAVQRPVDTEERGTSVTAARAAQKTEDTAAGDPNRNYAKTLRLTSTQLKALNLKHGPNLMSFSVNRATCQAYMYYWTHNVPVVISDIDGTITKSDALGHVLNMIGRDWTHIGVAKLYTDIVANGYNILYLTSRSVGQADTTRTYLDGVAQDGYKLPKGPVILSPDRTIAALRREIYLRKPEVFKMACLRDILNLFAGQRNPFYAGFGNRLTDALSYRSVNIPSTRIFTINSDAEVSLDLLTLTKYKSSYVTMREVVDHFFPPVSLLVPGGGENFTDFNYWRNTPLDWDEFSASDGDGDEASERYEKSLRSEDEGSVDADEGEYLGDSILESIDGNAPRPNELLEKGVTLDDDGEDVLATELEKAHVADQGPLKENWSRNPVRQEVILPDL